MVVDSSREHKGVLQVVEHYLQEVCSRYDSVSHMEAKLPTTRFVCLPLCKQFDAY